ncbi:hypothetical protein [Thiohalorhabdus methylotrophus]|uniref:Uncharacterized protein n=1 Tax=Thiohalorhabdus methylotrophus TaxID=3242694 RepID=A0ABV4TXP4_9GAMM
MDDHIVLSAHAQAAWNGEVYEFLGDHLGLDRGSIKEKQAELLGKGLLAPTSFGLRLTSKGHQKLDALDQEFGAYDF